MTGGAVVRKLSQFVIGIYCLIVIFLVTANAGIRSIFIVSIMTLDTVVCNGFVSSFEHIKLVMNIKLGRHPIRSGSMANGTVIRKSELAMIGIG